MSQIVGVLITASNHYPELPGNSTVHWIPEIINFATPFLISLISYVWMIARIKETIIQASNGQFEHSGQPGLVKDMEVLSLQVLENATNLNQFSVKGRNVAEAVLPLAGQSADQLREVGRIVDQLNNDMGDEQNLINNFSYHQSQYDSIREHSPGAS